MVKTINKLRVLIILLLVIALSGCGKQSNDGLGASSGSGTLITDNEPEYPRIVYIENNTYYGTNEKCEMVPRKSPDGIIETFVDKEIMPDAYNSANFGAEQGKIEYMFLEDNQLIVHIGEDWFYFEKAGDSIEITS